MSLILLRTGEVWVKIDGYKLIFVNLTFRNDVLISARKNIQFSVETIDRARYNDLYQLRSNQFMHDVGTYFRETKSELVFLCLEISSS